MKTALRLSCGLLLIVSAVGCHTCQHSCGDQSCQPRRSCLHKSCLHKLFKGRGGCGCHSGCNEGCCGGEGEMACDCGHHHHHKSKMNYDLPAEATMHGYDKSVVYTGDDWQGIPQPVMGGMMPMNVGCAGCAGGPPMMSMPSVGCAGCGGSGMSPIPSDGGCASCAGTGVAPQPATGGGCASCAGNQSSPTPATPPTGGSCASCGAGASAESFYNPMGPHHITPAPAPPAEGAPAPSIESVPGGEKAATSGSEPIQKIHWVPRQL